MSDTFLTPEEVATLTGRKLKGHQIEALRKMGIRFWVNAIGRPIIPRSAIDGGSKAPPDQPKKKWEPRVFQEMREKEEREAQLKRELALKGKAKS